MKESPYSESTITSHQPSRGAKVTLPGSAKPLVWKPVNGLDRGDPRVVEEKSALPACVDHQSFTDIITLQRTVTAIHKPFYHELNEKQ